MITGTSDCYSQSLPLHGGVQAQVVPETNSSSSFLFNLSILKNKVHQIQCLAGVLLSPINGESTIGLPTMTNLIQETIVAASSMMFSFQQMENGDGGRGPGIDIVDQWFEDSDRRINKKKKIDDSSDSYDIIELDAPDLLAKYTHYCHVCGKGFKRDANLRMHMRAHGDEYKSIAALSNPKKSNNNNDNNNNNIVEYPLPRKYSCPHEGCRWNKNHAKFQPLKSMICVKNHYKRSHCPKMYICKRCNNKQFSVLSDLRTHEKHCGDLKWQCSCGTTFSRKDKLMGHVALFVGHAPVVVPGARVLNSPGIW